MKNETQAKAITKQELQIQKPHFLLKIRIAGDQRTETRGKS